MTNPPGDVIDLLRELLRSELKHVHSRLDQLGRELGVLRLENKADHQKMSQQVGDIGERVHGLETHSRDEDQYEKGRQSAEDRFRRRDIWILGALLSAATIVISKVDVLWELLK